MRQMAAVVLKQHVKEHWTTEAKYFRAPVVGDAEKAAVRAALLPGLADSSSLLRTAVGLAISAIAKWHALVSHTQTHRKLVEMSSSTWSPAYVSHSVHPMILYTKQGFCKSLFCAPETSKNI